jgi:tRNA-dihydrouridine synthase
MVGRASIGAPWIFHDIKECMHSSDGTYTPLSLAERFALLRRQIHESVERIDEYRGILHVRRHLAASPLFKGIPSFRETRIAMLRANTLAELEQILDRVQDMLSNNQ